MAFAQTPKNHHRAPATGDQKFASEAAIGGMAEVEMGKLAVSKATNPDVKSFGQKMVDDHSKAGDELKTVASKENIHLPGAMDSKHKATIDRLGSLNGAEFDKAYVKEMMRDHEMDVQEFRREASSGTNKGVKDFAAKTLPTLQEHLRLIKDVDSKLSKGSE
jgi:putative membrane protein